jgi:hypothetical protein
MKIVINTCYGNFSLSHEAILAYCKLLELPVWPEKEEEFWSYWTVPPETRVKQISIDAFYELPQAERAVYNAVYIEQTLDYNDIDRDDPVLIQVVEELGVLANGHYTKLKVVEIPDDVAWTIENTAGKEHIAEVGRVWS